MNSLNLKLITPHGTLLDEEINQATMNTEAGEITVLANHTPLVSVLRAGTLLAKKDGKNMPLAVAGGIIQFFKNKLIILTDTAEHASGIDLERAQQKAAKLARELGQKEKMNLTTYKTLQRQLEREQARIGVAKKWRK